MNFSKYFIFNLISLKQQDEFNHITFLNDDKQSDTIIRLIIRYKQTAISHN